MRNQIVSNILLLGLGGLGISHSCFADNSANVYVDWQSRYISEGRNNLPSGGIVWSGIDYQHGSLLLFERQGVATSEDFIEFNGGIGYQQPLNDWLFSGSYTRLEFFGDARSHDNELALQIDYQGLDWLTPSLVYTYATEATGGFLEFSLTGHWPVNNNISLLPYVMQAWDFGYASDDFDGPNNLQFGLMSDVWLSPMFMLSWHISRTIAMRDIQHELGDACHEQQTFGGISLAYQF